MTASERDTTSPRSGFVPLCAKRWPLLCLLLAGCLNPMPEEFPARPESMPDRGTGAGAGPAPYTGEPDQEPNGPVVDGDGEPLPPASQVPAPSDTEAPDAGAADAAAPDDLVSEP